LDSIRIALVSQSINEETYKELAFPIGLCYLASYAEKYCRPKLEIKLYDGTVKVEDIDADVVGISAMSRYIPRAEELAKGLKKRGKCTTLLGGPHISALPHTLHEAFDAGVIDEGEATFLELLELYSTHGHLPVEQLAEIRGISFHKGGDVAVTEPRPHIEPLDTIPYPARHLWNIRDKVKWIASSRGCPYQCAFCGMARTKYRKFPAAYVVKELQEMKELYGIKAAIFQDDLFIADKKRLREIVELIAQKRLNEEMSFMVSLRADLIDETVLDLLKTMNVKTIFMGIESGSPKVLQFLKNHTLSVPEMQNAIDLCHKYSIQVEGSFIIGSPMEKQEDIGDTYNFIYDNYMAGKLDMIAVYILTPFPGTRVWQMAKARGLVDDFMDWSKLNLFTINEFNPEKFIYLNEKMPIEEFSHYVEVFRKLLLVVNSKGMGRMVKNIFEPMNVSYD
jgi:radical SAM superfamily enzyme YgiQ (UPF0313 family)